MVDSYGITRYTRQFETPFAAMSTEYVQPVQIAASLLLPMTRALGALNLTLPCHRGAVIGVA